MWIFSDCQDGLDMLNQPAKTWEFFQCFWLELGAKAEKNKCIFFFSNNN